MKTQGNPRQCCYPCLNCEVSPMIEVLEYDAGYNKTITIYNNEIVFVMEGRLSFVFRNHPEKTIRKGQFVFNSAGGELHFSILSETSILVVRLNGALRLCEKYPIERLYKGHGSEGDPPGDDGLPLEANRQIWNFFTGLSKILQAGFNCIYYSELKTKELFILLKLYYSDDQLRCFFAPILSPDTVFSEYVRSNFHRYGTVSELAQSMNSSLKHFEKNFARVFGGVSPKKWINSERAQIIYRELSSSTKPLKQITDDHNFSNQQQLNKFCKRELGKNPGEIRREGKEQKK